MKYSKVKIPVGCRTSVVLPLSWEKQWRESVCC